MPKKIRKKQTPKKYPERASDVPVTQRMLYGVRDELIARMDSGFANMDSRFAKMDSRFAKMDGRFSNIESRFASIDSRFLGLEAQIHELKVLIEEQNARNIIVLDGLTGLFGRQERIENEWVDFKKLYSR